MAKMQYQGTGRRKSSVARVRLIPGTGKITVNKKDLEEYFGMEIVKREVRREKKRSTRDTQVILVA